MQFQNNAATAATELQTFFQEPSNYAHAGNRAALVLERLPSGDHAWLRPEAVVEDSNPAEPDDALYWPTQSGRDLIARWRAEAVLFGPVSTVAEGSL